MRTKINAVYLIIFCTMLVVITGVCVQHNRAKSGDLSSRKTGDIYKPTEVWVKKSLHTKQVASSIHADNVKKIPTQIDPIDLWPEFSSLSKEEEQEFKLVQDQAVRFYSWGEIDPSQIEIFRQTLFKMHNRGIAHISRQLLSASRENVKSPESAKETIDKIDTLRYFAENNIAVANDAINKIVNRGYQYDAEGNPLDRVQAQVTLEAFEVLAKTRPTEANMVLGMLNSEQILPYSYHYVLGRRIAGEKTEETIFVLQDLFGKELTEFMKTAKLI